MTLLDHVWQHLITQGVGRDPRVAGALPPIWRHPNSGAPAPGESANPVERSDDAVISLFFSGGLATRRFDSARRRDIVDIWIRASKTPRALELAAEIRRLLIDQTNWRLGDPGGITVIESQEWRPLQPLATETPEATFFTGVLFETYAA